MGRSVGIEVSKLIIHLEAQHDARYHNDYHRKLRGVILNTLPDQFIPTDDEATVPLSFTKLIPWGDISQGDTRRVIVSSFDEELIGHLANEIQDKREINIGDWQFRVDGVVDATADVGQPGSRGTLESDTGTFVTLDHETAAEYGIEQDSTSDHFWNEGDPVQALTDRIDEVLSAKWGQHNPPGETGGPQAVNGPLFDQVELDTTYSVPVRVTASEERTFVLNKFTFEYEVRSEAHREALNFALSVGIGERNSYGLGTLTVVDKQEPVLTGM